MAVLFSHEVSPPLSTPSWLCVASISVRMTRDNDIGRRRQRRFHLLRFIGHVVAGFAFVIGVVGFHISLNEANIFEA